MALIAAARSFGQHGLHNRPAYSKCCRDRAGPFPLACIRLASTAFFSSSTLGRPMCCPRARRASRAAARRSKPSSANPREHAGHASYGARPEATGHDQRRWHQRWQGIWRANSTKFRTLRSRPEPSRFTVSRRFGWNRPMIRRRTASGCLPCT